MKKICILQILLVFFNGYSQDSIRISGQLLNNTRFASVVIKKFNIGSYNIAAVPIQKDGSFNIRVPKSIEPGVYRFQYSQSDGNGSLDVIIDGKENEINFKFDLNEQIENRSPIFSKSKENSLWYQYQENKHVSLKKIQALQQLLASYPVETDKVVSQVQEIIKQEKKYYYLQEMQFKKQNPNSWAAKMVQNRPYYFTNPKDDWRLQAFEVKEHYWEKITTTDPQLINSPLYTEHILEYIKYYMNPEMQFGEQEMNEGFIKSVDTIMERFGKNDKTKQFALQYLQLGFKEIGNEKVLQYLDEKYAVLEQCTTKDNDLDKRLKSYDALRIGNIAPKIELTATDGSVKTLSDYPEEKVVLVFWASWCPHCTQEVPKLQEWAKGTKNTLFLAVSLDEDYTAFQNAVAQFPNMLHICDLQKWNGKIATDYYITATPTLFVLDKDRKIVGKYSNVSSLIQEQTNNLELN